MIKCLPGLGRHGAAGDPIDIRYEVRFHSVNNLPELEQGKTLLIVWEQAWGRGSNRQTGHTTPKPVEGPTVTWLGRREGKVSFTTKMKRQHLHAAAKRHTKKSLKLFVVEPHGTGYRKLYKGRLSLAEYTDEVVCAQVGLVLHPCLKYYWNSNPILQMYISSKWVGDEAQMFRSISRKASAFLEFDYISDHIDQCLKESLKGTQNEIITISNECKTLKKKYRRQRAMLHETLERLQQKEEEVQELTQQQQQQHDDDDEQHSARKRAISWEGDASDGEHTTSCVQEEQGEAEIAHAVAKDEPQQISTDTFLTFLSIVWAYRNIYKRVLEFMLCYFLGAMQMMHHPPQ